VIGAVLGFLSVYVVLRRMVFLSATVTQASGLGVALAFYAEIHLGWHLDPSWGAVGLSLGTAALLVGDPQRFGLTREQLLGLAYALTGGAAVLVGSRISQEAHEISAILFGPAVLVSEVDLSRVLWAGAIVMLLQLWWFRGFTFASFDPIGARVQRLPVRVIDGALLLSIGVMVGVSARAIGALPVFSLSVLPGTAALLVARGRLLVTYALAALFGAAAGGGGYLLAFFGEFPVGASQTAAACAIAAVALIARLAIASLHRLIARHER